MAGKRNRRGSALLAVLWLSAALAAIAFTVAHTVRGETERASTAADGVRSYYLAAGGIERTLLYMQWAGQPGPDGKPRYWRAGVPVLRHSFPEGEAVVELIPDSAKLNVNAASREDLLRMLRQLGAEPQRAEVIAEGIIDWRTPSTTPTAFDAHYLGQPSSFRAPHASFQETEELLLVRGMTPELYYGRTERTADGKLVTHAGLRECVSTFGSTGGGLDINTSEPPVLLAAGIPPDLVSAIVQRRGQRPFTPEELPAFVQQHPSLSRLTVGGGAIYTLRSTARLKLQDGRLSDLRRTVEAQIALLTSPIYGKPWQILRWYENSPRLP